MKKRIKQLIEMLDCKFSDGCLYAPENCHFIKDDEERPHHLYLEKYSDEELLTILNRGTESCHHVHCKQYRDNQSPCGFWSSYNNRQENDLKQKKEDGLLSILRETLHELEYLENKGLQVLVADKVRNALNKYNGENHELRYNIL